MNELQSQVEHTVIAFRPRSATVATLSALDRLELAQWQERICLSGHRAVLYEREAGDSPEVGAFLSIYRKGEPWARWSVARMDTKLSAWCGRTSQDVGSFRSVREMLQALLPGCMDDQAAGNSLSTGLLITLSRVS